MNIEDLDSNLYLFVLIITSGIVTYGFRLIGYLFSKKINEQGELIRLVNFIATAFIAAMLSHIVLFPVGSLVDIALTNRVLALIAGVILFLLSGKKLAIGVVSSIVILIILEKLF